MRLISYDCEVFAYDWLVTLKDKETGVYTCIWNDNEALKMALSDDCIYVGFNSKHYDQYIIKAIAAGFAPEEIKKVNDFIIAGGQGWQCPLLDGIYFRFSNVDIRDDTQQGLSLKAIEGHLGMSVKESSVPFDIDRPLTSEEKAETEFYCKHDVDTAERLIDIRKDYLKNKINLGRLAGLDEVKAMGMLRIPTEREIFGENPYGKNEPVSVRRFYGMENRRERIAFQGSETGTWEWYWLQNKVEDSASDFAGVNSYGDACYGASNSLGVRPVFLLS